MLLFPLDLLYVLLDLFLNIGSDSEFSSITLGYIHAPSVPDTSYDTWHIWPVFGVFLGTNLIGLAVVIFRRDVVWTVAATWICISIWSLRPKPVPIYVCAFHRRMSDIHSHNLYQVTAIMCTVLHPSALFITQLYHIFCERQPIVLEGVNEHPGLYRHQTEQERRRRESERNPREISEDDMWN